MYYYKVAEVVIQSVHRLKSFGAFAYEPGQADMILEDTDEVPPLGYGICSGTIVHHKTTDGWYFHLRQDKQRGLFISSDYSFLRLRWNCGEEISDIPEWLVRIALQCMLACRGYVSLHSAAVNVNGEAFAFTAPSGVGKSTRAQAWIDALDAELINGDRPLINVCRMELYGVPWDGKEQCFRNVSFPLKTICEVRRAKSAYVRKLSYAQKRNVLMQQCFIPMWDTETAAIQIANISRLAEETNIVRIFSGPTISDAQAIYNLVQKQQTLEEKKDLIANRKFITRNIVDEHIRALSAYNNGEFAKMIPISEVSTLIWEVLHNPVSRDDLLKILLDEYPADEMNVVMKLDLLLQRLKENGMLTEL